MSSDIDICNMALSIVGSNTTITSYSPPDGTAAAQYCATFYPIARRELLAPFEWSFARTRADLAAVANPSGVWAYAYALPSDCIRPVRVAALAQAQVYADWMGVSQGWGWRFDEAGGADFIVERQATQSILLTNEPDAVLFYIIDQLNPTTYSPGFAAALAYMLASYLSGPIIRGAAGAKTSAAFRQQALGMAGAAAATDANGGVSERADHVSASLMARA